MHVDATELVPGARGTLTGTLEAAREARLLDSKRPEGAVLQLKREHAALG
jgi:hypothetical protein